MFIGKQICSNKEFTVSHITAANEWILSDFVQNLFCFAKMSYIREDSIRIGVLKNGVVLHVFVSWL